jgi:signal recognition particle subunit SRP54
MFDSLGLKLQDTIQNLRGQKKITEENIDSTLTDIRRRLLESDVSLKAVKLFTSRVKEEALGKDVITGINPGEQLVQIIHSALVEILGGKIVTEAQLNIVEHLSLGEDTCSILLLGLQGAGKTTTSAKLAYKLKQAGKNPLLVPCDLQRPAAVKQLKILAKQAEVDFLDITQEGSDLYTVSSVLELVKLAQQESDKNKNKVLIFDTAGRLQVDTDLMAELLLLEKQVKPAEKLLVLDSLIGQEAANVADTFNTQIGITGSILTKMDSDTRGGAALSVVEATNKPIKLAAVGEKLDDLEIFYPDRIASRILGMGDVLSLVEKAQERIDEIESKRLEAELLKGNFNYETFMTFQNMMSKLGDFTSIFKMMGMGNLLSQMGLTGINHNDVLEQGQSKMQKFRIAINSMTKEERKNPDLLSTSASAKSRRARITRGSGLREADISQLSSEFIKMSKTFKTIGPMLNMMGNTDTPEQKINPHDMMNHMLGGLSKKQRQAAKHAGMLPNKLAKPEKKIKKGEKPSVKGFRT